MDKQSEVDTLFRTHSIEEIKDAERNLRGEIEKKKEDLRVMVGERYRDLINAADTITQMKNLSQEVHVGINTIQKCCREFKKRNSVRRRTTSEDIKLGNEEINFYTLATQMELLVGTPEKIWDALDKQQFLLAAQLYLLGHHIVNNSLHINTGYGNQSDVFANFPILHHQWAAISHFKHSILKGSALALRDPTLPDKALAECLCSTILLNDSSPRQVFMDFLLARKSAIQGLFHPSQHKSSIKRQICDVTSFVILTLQQIFSLFYPPQSQANVNSSDAKSLLYQTIQEATKKKQSDHGEALKWLFGDEFDVLTVARHLPSAVSEFRPKMNNVMNVVPLQTVRNGAKEWLAGCIKDIHDGVIKLLKYIKSIKSLASVRDSVHELLANSRLFNGQVDGSENTPHDPHNWIHLCETILDGRLSLWNELYDALYVERAKDILNEKFDDTLTATTKSADETIAKLEETIKCGDSELTWDRNVTSYLWDELPGDFPSSGWCMDANQGLLSEMSSLTLKAKGCTPAIRSLCLVLDHRLEQIADDSKYLFEDVEKKENLKTTKPEVRRFAFEQDTRIEPFEKFAGIQEKRAYIQECSLKLVENFCAHVSKSLDELKSQLSNTQDADECYQSLFLDRVTFFGRVCMAIPNCCSNLKRLASASEDVSKSTATQRETKFSQRKAKYSRTGISPALDKMYGAFLQRQKKAFRIWKDWIVNNCSKLVDQTITSPDGLIVYGTTCWEDIAIEEEAETGNKIQSKIQIPSQVSSFVNSILFRICEEINRVGGHVIDRSLVKELALDVGNTFLERFETLVKDSPGLSQNSALQFIFDAKFLVLFIAGNADTKDETAKLFKKRGNLLVGKLESFVDPFDLDVFTPHMTNFIHRQIQRSWLLLGTISNIEKHSLPHTVNRPSTVSQEQHNVVPLAPNPVRFMLLPISTQQEKASPSRIEEMGFEERNNTNEKDKPSINCPLFEHLHHFTLEFQ